MCQRMRFYSPEMHFGSESLKRTDLLQEWEKGGMATLCNHEHFFPLWQEISLLKPIKISFIDT